MKTLILRRYKGRSPVSVLVDDEDYDIVRQHAWYLHPLGYIAGKANGKRTYLHRFIMKPLPGKVIDHINGDKLDNRRCNLRACEVKENVRNASRPSNNTSGYTGVSFRKDRNVYRANIMVDRKQIHLGHYKTIDGAIMARKRAEKK